MIKKLTSSQVAQILGCSINTVHRIPPHMLPYTLVGSHRRYNPEDVNTYERKQRITGEASGV